MEEKKLTLGEVRLSDSSIKYVFPPKDEEIKEIDTKIIDKIFDVFETGPIPIDTVLVENTRIFANHDLFEAKRVKFLKNKKNIVTRFHVANIKPNEELDFKIDEAWGDAEITKKNITIFRLKLQHDVQSLIVKGKIKKFYKLKQSEMNLNGETQLYLEGLKNDLHLPDEIEIHEGFAKAGFVLDYKDSNLSIHSDIFLRDFRSNMFFADELRSEVSFEKNRLSVKKLSLRYQNEKLDLDSPVEVYNQSNRSYLTRPIFVNVENLRLSNALRILPSMEKLHGELNGKVEFNYKLGNLFFLPKENFIVRNLAFVVGNKKEPYTVLKISKAKLRNSSFSVVNNEFRMSSFVELAHSKFKVDGLVNKKIVEFSAPNAKIDFEDFGNISNLDIKGVGDLNISVAGPLNSTVINLVGESKGFEILGYKLDETEKNISIELDDSNVVINKMESRQGKTNISATGTVNYRDADIALGITTNDTNFSDLAQIIHPIFKNLNFLPPDLDFKAKMDVDIFGKYRLDDLKLTSKINFTDLIAFGENINSGSLDISLMNRVLSFKNLNAEKGAGSIWGDFIFGLRDNSIKVNYRWENLELSHFNAHKRFGVNLNSLLSGKVAGGGTLNNYLLKLDMIGFDTKTQNYKFNDSHILLNILNDRISGKINLLGEILKSDFNIALKKGNASDIKMKLEANDLRPFLVAFLGQHLESEEFNGKLCFEGETSFNDGFRNLDLIASLKELTFTHPQFSVNYISNHPEFIVKDSIVQAWDLNISDPDFYVTSKGHGLFGKNVALVHQINLNSKIFEILSAQILSSEGYLQNLLKINGVGTDFNFSVASKTENIDLFLDQFPVPINDLKYEMSFANNRLTIDKLISSLDNGTAALGGEVYFDNNQPDVNIKFTLDRAEFPILGKSSANISGEGILLGNSFPYNLSGEVILNRAQIVNELNEFSNKSAAFSQIRFLPKNQESTVGKMVNLNLNVKAETPVRISNSMMDIALIGELRLTGNPSRPRGEGRLTTPPSTSRIFFKNIEYNITKADINFNAKKEISNPDFDVEALAYISNYKVKPKAYGDLERFNFDLSSEPPLARNSVLSLIAFGYTNEVQNSLQSKDQQSLTNIGVGSFVFDRFKISDILNKQFGLQINLGTVIEQSATDSLLTGRSQEGSFGQGGGAIGRTRSATKIELKKRIDEAVTLSVSSTMGGSIGQRQSMNLNYGINKNVQLEGVYEIKSNQFGQEDIIYNSIGGDIKFRKTFP